MAVKTKPATKSSKSTATKEMTPLEKARAARAANAAAGKKAGPGRRTAGKRTPPKKFEFNAPEGVKSFFVQATARFTVDGMLAPGAKLVAIKGKPDNPNAPRYNLTELDPQTAFAFFGRLTPVLYAANPARRMPPKSVYGILVRVSVTGTGLMRCGVKSIVTINGKKATPLVDKTNPEYRRIRRVAKLLPGAFTRVPDMNELKLRQKAFDAQQQTEE